MLFYCFLLNVTLLKSRLQLSAQEILKLRSDKHEMETYIGAFKRELGNIVGSLATGKELEESVNTLYRKYVKEEVVKGKMMKV